MQISSGKNLVLYGKQAVIKTRGKVCSSPRELLSSDIFEVIVRDFLTHIHHHDTVLWHDLFGSQPFERAAVQIIGLMRALAATSLDDLARILPFAKRLLKHRAQLDDFVQQLYNYWRNKERYLICLSEEGPWSFDNRPYRTFNSTVEQLTHVVRATYRDVAENVTNDHPRVYRQVQAGCQAGTIAVTKNLPLPDGPYAALHDIPLCRQVWLDPPIIIDPPVNKRTGEFERVAVNPLEGMRLNPEEWLCYPAQVGEVLIYIYFHHSFINLGLSLSNLFELADDRALERTPDAIYLFGAPADHMSRFGSLPTVFYEDSVNNILVGAVPGEDRFGYFGYLKKMALTLHNVAMMKRGRMPFHGAMCRILLKNGDYANILLIGDTATGKSETLEALRGLGGDRVQSIKVVADDMGSIEVDGDKSALRGYGTEIGAFVRLDDLQAGYAFGQIDRAILMSPQKTNARVVLPITTLAEVCHGYPVHFLMYANNYEAVDRAHPVLSEFGSMQEALEVFSAGAAMTKGTTTSTGMVGNYFANIFGPVQYRSLHEPLAERIFRAAFEGGVWVGQMRTRLAIPGFEAKGPEAAAVELLRLIQRRARARRERKKL